MDPGIRIILRTREGAMFDRKGANGQESSSKPTIRAPRRKPEWDVSLSA